MIKPNYHKIFEDALSEVEDANKIILVKKILQNSNLSHFEILYLSEYIFGKSDNNKHKSYNLETIKNIIEYQKINNLSNFEISKIFKISRNSLTKWKKMLYEK